MGTAGFSSFIKEWNEFPWKYGETNSIAGDEEINQCASTLFHEITTYSNFACEQGIKKFRLRSIVNNAKL